MQSRIADINRITRGIRTNNSRYSAQTGKNLFQEHLSSAVQAESSFDRAVAPFLKNSTCVSGKNPMKFGIVQSTLRDYDPTGRIARNVSELDEKKAKEIYRMIWKRAGCSRMSPDLAAVHFNAYVNRPKSANEALAKSGSNPINYAHAIKSLTAKDGRQQSPSQIPLIRQTPLIADQIIIPNNISEINTKDNNAAEGASTIDKINHSECVSDNEQNIKKTAAMPGTFDQMKFSIVPNEIPINRKTVEDMAIPGGTSIAIEPRQHARQIDAYQNAKSKGMLSEGFFIKLRIPFS